MALVLPVRPLFGSKDVSVSASFSSPSKPGYSRAQSKKGSGLVLVSSGTPSPTMVSNGYLAGRAVKSEARSYRRLGSCLVIPPPAGRKPTAVVKFLGGAFVGAVPEVTYSFLMEWLAKEGFLVVSVPYNVTFDHEKAAKDVYERFHCCMDSLFASGIPDAGITALDISSLPLYSVGHRPAAEAVPYFEQFGPMVSQVMPIIEESPVYSMARNASGDAWKALLDTAGLLIQDYDQEAVVSLTKFIDQLPSVINQVTQGTSEFKPTPPENREFFKKSYSVPHTLLVKFSVDAIDETDLLEDILKPRVESIGGMVEKITLSGNHLTPCLQDLKWQVGYQYTPADALAQALKSLSLNETRVLARTVTNWLKDLNHK
ncbi:hypothetical protein MUK42_20648 [Musa troglodytarum]|uniref:Uncharacterized protein n=1 Tax=Musa troglodytarum TaxID=320322 RepID=A0A9E7K5N8_9LILI|nr:hypothetical protein MUK42_20648 [Musa troglodytarum]